MTSASSSSRTAFLAAGTLVAVYLLWALRSLLMLVAFSVLIAYALEPVVRGIECVRVWRGRPLPRPAAAATVMFAMVIGVAYAIDWAAPRLLAELGAFLKGVPANAERLLDAVHQYAVNHSASSGVDPALDSVRDSLAQGFQGLGGTMLHWAGRMMSGIGQLIGIAVLPLLSYYLMAERDDVKRSLLGFLPASAHPRFHEVLAAVDRALHSYVRGQAIVSIIMGTAVGCALALLGMPAALLLGLIVAIAEVLPYIGFMLAATAIALTGYGVDPLHAVLGLAAYTAINWTIGLLVTPRVMGRHLKMHPFVVTVSVLAGAELLGPPGAMLALPSAAVLQSLVEEFGPQAGGGRRRPAKTT